MAIAELYIWGDFDIDPAIEWAVENCASFEKYRLVELEDEEKLQLGCWFRLDVHFGLEQDKTWFLMRWS